VKRPSGASGAGRRAARGALALGLLSLAAGSVGCDATAPPPAVASASRARTAPDDGDLWNLAPAGATSIADVDMAVLARSPWSSSLVKGGFAEDREARQKTFGYDVFVDVDRLLVVATEPADAGGALTVARGRFDAGRVGASFLAATPGAVAARWRESPLWEGGGRAVALVTPRTLVQGSPEAVRGAIDAAWGAAPDARGGPLGTLRRELDAERPGAAVVLALVVTDEARARAAGFVELPDGLRRLGARLDLGADLDFSLRAVLDDGRHAADAAELWGASLQDLRRQRLVRALGMAPLVDGATVKAGGSQVYGHLRIGEDQRDMLSERLLLLLRTLASQRPGAASAQP
jgi:hypothetical protein